MMDADRMRKLLKRVAIAGVFFVLAFLFYQLGWRSALVGYALVVTVIMILVILLQSGRGGGLASMGGMGGSSMLGARASTPIAKATYIMGALFLFICLLVARLGNLQASSPEVLRQESSQQTEQPVPDSEDTAPDDTPAQPDETDSGGQEQTEETPPNTSPDTDDSNSEGEQQ